MWTSLLSFGGGLALVVISGIVLSGQIERVAARLHFSAGMLGIVAALGADAPEISSAVSALLSGHRDVGVGVVLGSNVFNLAGLLGLSATIAQNGVRVGKAGLWLNGGVALVVTGITALQVLRVVPGWLALVLVTAVLAPYVVVSSQHRDWFERTRLPGPVRSFLCDAVINVERDTRRYETPKRGAMLDALSIVPALASVVLGSAVMVSAVLDLGTRWAVPHTVIGVLVLAALTGIPNTIAALRLARHGRGAAVVSEALNSNSINVVFGICAPALWFGTSPPSMDTRIALAWLTGMTLAALVLASRASGLHAKAGAALLALYVAFAVVIVAV